MPFIIFEYVWGDGGGMENNEFRLKMTNVIFFNLIFREVVKRTLTFFKVREGGQLLCQSAPRQKKMEKTSHFQSLKIGFLVSKMVFWVKF